MLFCFKYTVKYRVRQIVFFIAGKYRFTVYKKKDDESVD